MLPDLRFEPAVAAEPGEFASARSWKDEPFAMHLPAHEPAAHLE